MKRIAAIVCVLSLLQMQTAFAQRVPGEVDSSLLPAQYAHYQAEYALDAPVNQQAWLDQKKGLHVAFVSTDRAWFRTEAPEQQENMVWEASGWRGERLNAEILIWSPDTLEQGRVGAVNLVNARGRSLRSRNTLNLVRYVLSNYPYGAKDAVCGNTPYKNGYLMPDRFEPFERFQLPGKTVRPVWLSVDLPADTEPGLYTGTVVVSTTRSSANLQI